MDGDGTRRFTSSRPPARHALAAQDPRRYRSTPASTNSSPVPQNATLATRHNESSSLSAERSSQPTAQNDITTSDAVTGQLAKSLSSETRDSDSIMPQFLIFFDAFVSLCIKQKEKEGLQASIERESKAEERVKTMLHHPGYKQLAQSIREGGNENLKRIEASIKTQEAICLQILPEAIKSIQSALRIVPPSLSNDTIAKLESDIADKFEAKFRAKLEAENEAKEARLSNIIEAKLRAKIEAEDEAKEARLTKKLEGELERRNVTFLKKIEDSHVKLMEQMEAKIRTAQLLSINPQDTIEEMEVDPGKQKSNSMEWYKQKYREHSPRLHELEVWKVDELPKRLATLASIQDCQAAQAKAEVAIQSVGRLESILQSGLATVRSDTTILRSEFSGLIPDLDARSSTHESHNIPGLGKSLTNNFDNLLLEHENQNHRITKLETESATMLTNLNSLAEKQQPPGDHSAQMVQTLRHDLSALIDRFSGLQESVSNELRKHRTYVDASLQQNEVAVKHANDTTETLRVAIRSLENRYLNITTEDLFKNMVQAMKEMFPWMESQHQEIAALKEQLIFLVDQSMTKTAFSNEIDVLKLDVAQRIDALKISTEDASPQALNDLVKDVQEFWTKIEKLKAAQIGQTVDIVKRVQEHAALRNQFETQSDAVEELAEKVSDLAEIFEKVNSLESKYERLKKDVTEMHKPSGNSQRMLPDPKGFCSPDTVNMICENLITRHEKATTEPRFDQLIKMTNEIGQQWANFKTQEFANLRLREHSPSRPRTNGSRSELERENEKALSPRLLRSSRDSPGASQASVTLQVPGNEPIDALPPPRSMSKPSSCSITPGSSDKLLQTKAKTPQEENDSPSNPSQDQSLGSRVAPSDIARSSSPSKVLPRAKESPQSILEKTKKSSKKRPRKSSLLSGDLNGNSLGTASPVMSEASPAPSSSSSLSRKKKRKKDKHPSKQ
ncbi:Tubulin alpha-1 chain [Penicillium atrosanguineum]|uniref:Uncharacterized protein n=1 Tax=Penicillium atrosanguineum TaxID=1132637 RepID=A0A9W9PT93_9EURO|nr:Tubulin alpha-1 chain [Penicillium atrosanguineum]KAJ5290638.1 Tubulin alpha-1 chain [Penicillium atrosanguineum]KAJ5308461.1 hypothetical protein N7476_009117 [Penicillium atrosanguineum]